MPIFKKKRETRLIFRDKTLRMVSGGEPDEQTGQITVKVCDLGLLKAGRDLTLPLSAFDVDIVSLLKSRQIRIDVPNFYANGQPVPIADRKEMMLRERLIQRERELVFAKRQLNSANQALESASMNPESMMEKRVQELEKLVNVVAPFMRTGGKSRREIPSMYVPPDFMQPAPIGDQIE